MTIEIKVPQLPESIADATVSTWHKKEGDSVTRDENIVDLETDKVMLEVPAPQNGILKKIIKNTGSTVKAQEVLAVIEPAEASSTKSLPKEKDEKSVDSSPSKKSAAQANTSTTVSDKDTHTDQAELVSGPG